MNRLGFWIGGAFLVIAALWRIRRGQDPAAPSAPASFRHEPVEIVQLDALQDAAGPEGERWRLTYRPANGEATELALAWNAERPSTNPGFSVASARLTRTSSGSDEALVEAVAAAFGGVPHDARDPKASELRFDLAILGRNLEFGSAAPQAQVIAGSFTDRPAGNWTVTKLFLAEGEGEVFLALNGRDHKALLLPKDPDYGEAVVRELGRLLR